MFGDILSDETAMLSGSVGMLGSAALAANGKALFEASHASAPDITGKKLAKPLAMILSAAMMLRYTFDRSEQASRIEKAIRTVFINGVRTGGIWQKGCKRVGTSEMGDAVLRAL